MWYGIEQEGYAKGINTLFVDKQKVTAQIIRKACLKYKCQRVYFGAGRDYEAHVKHVKKLIKWAKKNKIELVLETTKDKLSKNKKKLYRNCKVILTFSLAERCYDVVDKIKIDTYKSVYVLDVLAAQYTNLKHLNKTMFKNDKEVKI